MQEDTKKFQLYYSIHKSDIETETIIIIRQKKVVRQTDRFHQIGKNKTIVF